jgi:D-sedoheptulose 7-phosphate isomerase
MKRDFTKQIANYIELEIDTIRRLDQAAINEVMNVLEDARERGNHIYICGNGGSAATASHFTGDFNKGVSITQEKKYKFNCLLENIPAMMAIANDIGYDYIFEIPLQGKISQDDVLIAISGSGNSKNVIRAAQYAKQVGASVIALTGFDGGELYGLADYRLHVPVNNMQITEDVHMLFNHLMMWVLTSGN